MDNRHPAEDGEEGGEAGEAGGGGRAGGQTYQQTGQQTDQPADQPTDQEAEAGRGSWLCQNMNQHLTSPAARKAFLLGLIPHLSHDEIWMLQARLARLDLRTDILGRLPPELQILVADLLAPTDLGGCLNVSRVWRLIFLGETMRLQQTRRCFPALLEHTAAVESMRLRPTADVGQGIFVHTARKHAERNSGRFYTVFRHRLTPTLRALSGASRGPAWRWWDTEDGENDNPEAPWQTQFIGPEYAHGRLFWYLYDESTLQLLVDDLHSGRRRHYSVRDDDIHGERFLSCLFGDELVVVAFTGTRVLAWEFGTGRHYVKQMPAQVDMVETRGRRVCIQSQMSLYVWDVGGGSVLEVDTTGLGAQHRQPDQDGRLPSFFLLDPVRPDVFFRGNIILDMAEEGEDVAGGLGMGSTAPVSAGHLCFYLHEFRERRFRQTHTYRLPFEQHAFPSALIALTARSDDRGTFSLVLWRVSSPLAKGVLPTWASPDVRGVGCLSFNMYTCAFSRSYFQLPPLATSLGREQPTILRALVWDGQLLTMVDRHRETRADQAEHPGSSGSGGGRGGGSSSSSSSAAGLRMRKAEPLLFALDSAEGEAARCAPPRPFSAVPVYTDAGAGDAATGARRRRRCTLARLFPSGSWRVDDEEWARHGCVLRWILDLDARPDARQPERPAHIRNYYVAGDGDFVVMIHDGEYTVWGWELYE